MRSMRTVLLGLVLAFAVLAGADLVARQLGQPAPVLGAGTSPSLALQAWLLEALAFVAVARLLVGRGGAVLDGLLVGGVVWVLRWPLLVVTLGGLGVRVDQPWGALARQRLVLDLALGILLALVDRPRRAGTRAASRDAG